MEGLRIDITVEFRTRSLPLPVLTSALHADHLFDLSDDFNQVFLVLHHRFDRFVTAGNFIQHAYVFATFNDRSLTSVVVFREGSLRSSASILATGTVRARIE